MPDLPDVGTVDGIADVGFALAAWIALERELRKANEILKAASVFFAKELDPTRPK